MLQLKTFTSKRKLDLPLYSLTQKKLRQKSCFIDSNRVDTVKPAVIEKNKNPKKLDKPARNNKAKP